MRRKSASGGVQQFRLWRMRRPPSFGPCLPAYPCRRLASMARIVTELIKLLRSGVGDADSLGAQARRVARLGHCDKLGEPLPVWGVAGLGKVRRRRHLAGGGGHVERRVKRNAGSPFNRLTWSRTASGLVASWSSACSTLPLTTGSNASNSRAASGAKTMVRPLLTPASSASPRCAACRRRSRRNAGRRRGLADALLVLDQSQPHEVVAVLAEADSRRDGDVGLLDQQIREFEAAEMAKFLRHRRPGEHRGARLVDRPAGGGDSLGQVHLDVVRIDGSSPANVVFSASAWLPRVNSAGKRPVP